MISIGQINTTSVVLLHIEKQNVTSSQEIHELESLVTALARRVHFIFKLKQRRANPKTLLGSGQVKELFYIIQQLGTVSVIVNTELTPSQQNNLAKLWCVDVIDRTQVIFDLFSRRATSHMGKIQVELASLRYAATRLVGGWTHLERQRGGIGLRGGPGESQLEVDRRLVKERIRRLEKKLLKLQSQQCQNRQRRIKNRVPIIAIMGYTNAGKTTLYNALTNQLQFAENQIFATLDPKAGRIRLANGLEAIVMDTVGFVRNLPKNLLDAFRATLDEIQYANLICIVVDASSDHADIELATMKSTLEQLGLHNRSQLLIYNKADLVQSDDFICSRAICANNPDDINHLKCKLTDLISIDTD